MLDDGELAEDGEVDEDAPADGLPVEAEPEEAGGVDDEDEEADGVDDLEAADLLALSCPQAASATAAAAAISRDLFIGFPVSKWVCLKGARILRTPM